MSFSSERRKKNPASINTFTQLQSMPGFAQAVLKIMDLSVLLNGGRFRISSLNRIHWCNRRRSKSTVFCAESISSKRKNKKNANKHRNGRLVNKLLSQELAHRIWNEFFQTWNSCVGIAKLLLSSYRWEASYKIENKIYKKTKRMWFNLLLVVCSIAALIIDRKTKNIFK